MSKIDELNDGFNRRTQFARTSLSGRCRALADHMIKLANRLDSDIPHEKLCINDLGEVQSQGTIIDAECGRLGVRIESLKLFNELASDIKGE